MRTCIRDVECGPEGPATKAKQSQLEAAKARAGAYAQVVSGKPCMEAMVQISKHSQRAKDELATVHPHELKNVELLLKAVAD